jgi:hypothetical protein
LKNVIHAEFEKAVARAVHFFRVVCGTCNNGWMSRLETAASPLLTPLITGNPCTISEDSALTIAKWITLKVLVGEHNKRGDAVTTQEQRDSFQTTQTIPDNFRIWIGRCGVDGWETAFWRHAGTVGPSPHVRPEPKLKNIQSVTFGIGELFVSAFHTTVENLPLTFSLERGGLMTSLLPIGSPIDWPPTKTLTGSEASSIAHDLERLFRSDDVRWMP